MENYLLINDSVTVEYESDTGLFFNAQVTLSAYANADEAKKAALELAKKFESDYIEGKRGSAE